MKVSIVIPYYNVATYVADTLASVARQAETCHAEIDCLLIDDASTDQSAEICQRWTQADQSRIGWRLLSQSHNMGPSAARNRGIREATDDYLYFMDGDDTIVPDCLSLLLEPVVLHPGVEMVHAGMKRTDGDRWMSIEGRQLPAYTADRRLIKIDLIGNESLTESCCNRLYLRTLLTGNQLYFDESIGKHEDDLWNNTLAKHVTRLAILPHDTYIYNVHHGSITTTHDGPEDMFCRLDIDERIIRQIDPLFQREQVHRILDHEFYYYLNNDNPAVRRRIGQLHRLIARYCPLKQRVKLYALAFLTQFDRGDHSLAFRLYRRFRKHALS